MTNNATQRMAINARLTDDMAADLDQIMEYHGLENKADMIRLLLRQEARRVAGLVAASPTIAEALAAHVRGELTASEALSLIAGQVPTHTGN